MRGEREGGRVKVRAPSLLPHNRKLTFSAFNADHSKFGDYFMPLWRTALNRKPRSWGFLGTNLHKEHV